jgi:hypothetical protein
LNDTNSGKPQKVEFGQFSIANYYEGDVVFLRLELDDDGTNSSNIGIIELGLNGVKITQGGTI